MKTPTTMTLAVALLGLAMPALAGDGVFEIHQTCVATGCFPGDTAGFPVTITSSGSYRLTSNLVLPDENTTGINILVDHVTLDLGGFNIAGSTVCQWQIGPPPEVACAPTGPGMGVDATFATGVEIHDGFVLGTGSLGISLGEGAVRDVEVRHAGSYGIRVQSDPVKSSLVLRCRVDLTGDAAITSASVVDSEVSHSGGTGIWGYVVRGNRVYRAVHGGITGLGTVEGNFVESTGDVGIFAASAIIRSNKVLSSTFSGVSCESGESCLVVGNIIRSAGGYGLSLTGFSGYGNNTINSCNGGNANPQVVGGHEIATNVCGGDTTCP